MFLSRRKDGFTLMELIIVMVLIGIMTSISINIVIRTLEAQKADSTLLEMEIIKRAIAGDPSLIINGRRADFGFYGDMGIMPTALTDLLTQGSQPALTNNTTYFITYGWGGPYLSKSFEGESDASIEDSWGNTYEYTNSKTVNASGDSVYGKITSRGANGVAGGTGYDADIDLEILKSELVSTVYGSAYTIDGNPMVSGKVYLRRPNGNATLKIDSVTTGLQGTYSFRSVPRGTRTLSFKPVGGIETNIKSILAAEGSVAVPRITNISNLIFVTGSATLVGSSNEQVQFQLRNLLGQTITIIDYRADYPGNVGTKYNQLNVNAVTLFSETLFADMAASSDQIDSKGSGMANFILPNNQTRTFLMSDFQNSSAVLQDMAGTSFTVILYSADGKQYSFDFSL
ncbi:MAG: prepilin-type N-terminal cleavage/methylation domain-containing protein [Candidatus Marinimicrobia bacterium]|nr:prepilin-type N-terminal cleavage/methylation domain-containing protein [Candidatus Neomarinimicrobiota bacterium]